MAPVGRNAFRHGSNEIIGAPTTDARFRIRCDVRNTEHAERGDQFEATGQRRVLLFRIGMTGMAAAQSGDIRTALRIASGQRAGREAQAYYQHRAREAPAQRSASLHGCGAVIAKDVVPGLGGLLFPGHLRYFTLRPRK